MKLYFIRHGQTDWNLARKIQGTTDIPLNENGIAQAHNVGRMLLEKKDLYPIDHIFTSSLKRASKTAEIIASYLELPYAEAPGFYEVNLGKFEGKTWAESREEFPEEFSFGLWLCRCYIDMNIRPYKNHLNEIREICKNILENCTIEDYRIEAMHMIIIAENEEHLDAWLDKVPCWKSCREILLETRCKYHNDIEKFNIQQQENLRHFLGYSFYNNCIYESSPKDTIEALTIVLKLIDVMRDNTKEHDAWMTVRADMLLRISGVYFSSGDMESGYTSLEEAIDLYEKYAELPIETELSYNCVLFNMLSENKKSNPEDDTNDKGEYVCYWAYQTLMNPNGCFALVHGEKRFEAMASRLLPYLPK